MNSGDALPDLSFIAGLPRVRAAAGALFWDEAGRVMVVHPTYKQQWGVGGVQRDDRCGVVGEGGVGDLRQQQVTGLSDIDVGDGVARVTRLPRQIRYGDTTMHRTPRKPAAAAE